LAVPRLLLYRRIDARCEGMLASGLLREAAALWADHLRPATAPGCSAPPSVRSIGYAQALALLATLRQHGAAAAPAALDACLADMQRASRNYAKRQHTWFRGEPAYTWVDASPEAGGRDGAFRAIIASFAADVHVPDASAADAPGVGCDNDRALVRALMVYVPQLTLFNRTFVRSAVLRWLCAWEAAQRREEGPYTAGGEAHADAAGASEGAAAPAAAARGAALPLGGISWRVRRRPDALPRRRAAPLRLRMTRSVTAAAVAAAREPQPED
jgi:hypothetical protein